MNRICLCMMVKNESRIIRRALDSALPYVTAVCVVDTGSTDGTVNEVERWACDRGLLRAVSLHHRPWKDFGHNRTETLQIATEYAHANGCNWLLLFDADETMEGTLPDLSLPVDRWTCQGQSPAGALSIERDGGEPAIVAAHSVEYNRTPLLRVGKPWRYVGATHEYLWLDEPYECRHCDTLRIVEHNDSDRRLSGRKLTEDLALLERQLDENPNDERAAFYAARTLMDLERFDEAETMFRRRIELGGRFHEEIWHAIVYLALCKQKQGQSPIGELLSAFEFCRGTRSESLLYAAAWFSEHEQHTLARLFTEAAARVPKPQDAVLWVDERCYDWRVFAELAQSCAFSGDASSAVVHLDRAIADPRCPDEIRDVLRHNRVEAIGKVEATR